VKERDDIRDELTSLRDRTIRAVRDERPSEVDEGLDLYRELVRTFVRRLANYGARYDRREAHAEVSGIPSRGWPEIAWIQEDYIEILRTAFRYPTQKILGMVLYFPVSVSSVALYEGDYLSFQEFALGIPEYAYSLAAKLEDQELRNFAVERVWRFLKEFSNLVIGERIEAVNDVEELERIGEIAEGVLLIFNGLLKTAFELRRLEDFQQFITRMGQLFDERQFGGSDFQDWHVTHRHVLAHEESGEAPRYETISRILDTLQGRQRLIRFGLNGWITRRYAGSTLTAEEFQKWFTACGSFGDLSRLTRLYLESIEMSHQDLLRWEWWALEGTEGVVNIDVDGWFHRIYALHALNELSQSVHGAPATITLGWPREVRFLIDRESGPLRTAVKDVGDHPERWRTVLREGAVERIGELSAILDAEIARIERDWRQSVTQSPLNAERVSAFRQANLEGYQNGWNFRDLVWSQDKSLITPNAEASNKALGYHRLLPKEYFVEGTNIVLGPFAEDLGRQLASEVERHALGEFVSQLQPIEASAVALDVEKAIETLKKSGHVPTVVLLGSWAAYMELYPQLEQGRALENAGRFKGAVVHNFPFPTHSLILVGDLSRMGEWRQYSVTTSWAQESLLNGELSFSLAEITRAEAEEQVRAEGGSGPTPSADKVDELLQKVRFRLFAHAQYRLASADAVVCLRHRQPDKTG